MKSRIAFLRLLVVIVLCALVVALIAAATAPYTTQIAGVPAMLMLAIIAFGIQFFAFIPAYLLQTEKFYDLTGSITFVCLVSVCVYQINALTWYHLVLALMVYIWALRLGAFLFIRVIKDGADDRFDNLKPDPSRFLTAWTIQGLWVFLSSAAVTAALVSTKISAGSDIFSTGYSEGAIAIGAILWIVGFTIEVIADWQKRQFKSKTRIDTPFICSGLWRYSRHPNYFGEITLWFGAAIFALPALSGWQHIVLISPIFVSLLLVKLSGVPLLEAKADKRFGELPEYQAYKHNTPSLIPRLW